MLNVKRSTVGALSTVALVLCLTLGLAACAPQTSEPGADAEDVYKRQDLIAYWTRFPT